MDKDAALFDRHLRVIHACEKGATGVYWGHRLIAFAFYRDLIPQLTLMHAHETEHYALFGELIRQKRTRRVPFPVLWCGGGILYGVFTALFGRRAIWKSTAIIEGIVEKELTEAADFFQHRDATVHATILRILEDERQHKLEAQAHCPEAAAVDALIEPTAKGGAALSKTLAQRC
ncbi:hypothetical protein D0B54_00170 [Solimonas sp. K1W22B-7]|uniref:demethoxyubiquinone hydroxylase family protein n=1 Tax=Solimonas sp. K1W22B-7 TaxID=2303331 RepID=UPI000E3361A5|nr:demethoxyubiquinone hydroxylase family protein [Solimonas sp. K1W22B-7]AXQ27199.1 hypothetical protein D0B54_00170 [Solimonas sp. K1W22B-7]